jgi:hypothetical protein
MQPQDGVPPAGYRQEAWVSVQHYASEPWIITLELWRAFNLHLAHVIEHADPTRLVAIAEIGGVPMTLQSLMIDYLRHLRHHLSQIPSV